MSSKLAWCAHVLLYLLLATAATHVSVSATNDTTSTTTTTTTTLTNATLAPANTTPAPANTTLTGCQICGATGNCTDAVAPGEKGKFCGIDLIGSNASGACCCPLDTFCRWDSTCICEEDPSGGPNPNFHPPEIFTTNFWLVVGGIFVSGIAVLCLLCFLCGKICGRRDKPSSRQRTGRVQVEATHQQ